MVAITAYHVTYSTRLCQQSVHIHDQHQKHQHQFILIWTPTVIINRGLDQLGSAEEDEQENSRYTEMSDLPSQIPRPTNKRSSLNFSSTILQNSTYPNTVGAGPSRASSPLTIPGKGLVNGVGGRISPAGRRGSLLNGGVGGKEDDPGVFLTLLIHRVLLPMG